VRLIFSSSPAASSHCRHSQGSAASTLLACRTYRSASAERNTADSSFLERAFGMRTATGPSPVSSWRSGRKPLRTTAAPPRSSRRSASPRRTAAGYGSTRTALDTVSSGVTIEANNEAKILLLAGESVDEPGALMDEAYPEIQGGVSAFIESYLDAKETVLVLQGPPGTGKTRLIRAILGEISRRNDGEAQVMYTGDLKALETDALFVKFITGWDDAFVVEDADHLLKPRSDGNQHLHRFLTIADGVVRSQGRKIIFSTNLPNVGDLDEALIRPGRCFGRLNVRAGRRLQR